MRGLYAASTEGAIALVAATAKTVIGVKSGSDFGLDCCGFEVSFDGVTASAVPVLVELMLSTWATNGTMGTNNTSTTPHQRNGRVIASGVTSGANWTSEPTVLTVIRNFLLTPAGGTLIYDFPLGTEPDCDLSQGFAIRCTAPAAVNVRAGLTWARN